MTGAGWIFLLLSWSVIIGMVAYCFRRVFAKKDTLDPRD